MKVGYSFWGILEKPELITSDATTAFSAAGERHLLVEEFLNAGHRVFILQQMREKNPYPCVDYHSNDFPDLDVLYLEWRWQQHSGLAVERKHEPDWDRQVQLLNEYSKRGTRIVAFDTDHKITEADELRWPGMLICEPSLWPSRITKARYFLPWATDFKRMFPEREEESYNYIYLGNNYERDRQFQKYYTFPAHPLRAAGIQTIAYGNWIEKSPSREDPKNIISRNSNVAFAGRASYYEGMKHMSKSICTALLAKESYYESGFITSRVYEGILAGIPSLVPKEHVYLKTMGACVDLIIDNTDSVEKKVRRLQKSSKEELKEIVDKQEKALRKLANFSPNFKMNKITQLGTR